MTIKITLYNRKPNYMLLRNSALKGLTDVLLTSTGKKVAFPPPSPPYNVVPLFELPVENTNTPTLNGGEGGGVWIVLFSEVTLTE